MALEKKKMVTESSLSALLGHLTYLLLFCFCQLYIITTVWELGHEGGDTFNKPRRIIFIYYNLGLFYRQVCKLIWKRKHEQIVKITKAVQDFGLTSK